MKIAYLGPKGSFSHHVVQTAFPKEELQAFANITDVIKAYEQGLVDYSVVPVENSIEGSVHESLDYLFHQALHPSSCRNCSTHSPAVDGGSRSVKN